jgi:hypothetical protein
MADATKNYEVVRKQSWTDDVTTWKWKPRGKTEWFKSGTCSECTHVMTVRIRKGVLPGIAPSQKLTTVLARCNCSGDHKNRPKDVSDGCGATGLIARPEAS